MGYEISLNDENDMEILRRPVNFNGIRRSMISFGPLDRDVSISKAILWHGEIKESEVRLSRKIEKGRIWTFTAVLAADNLTY